MGGSSFTSDPLYRPLALIVISVQCRSRAELDDLLSSGGWSVNQPTKADGHTVRSHCALACVNHRAAFPDHSATDSPCWSPLKGDRQEKHRGVSKPRL